jgi:hypothetical protein
MQSIAKVCYHVSTMIEKANVQIHHVVALMMPEKQHIPDLVEAFSQENGGF